jgi:signal transduction histidine kinase
MLAGTLFPGAEVRTTPEDRRTPCGQSSLDPSERGWTSTSAGALAAPAERLVEEDFLAILAHDVRSPLLTLTLSCELLSQRVDPADPVAARQLQAMRYTIRHIDRMVADVLCMVAEHGSPVPAMPSCPVRSVLVQAADDQRALAELKGVEITLGLPAESCHVALDRPGLLRVLANLLANAIHSTPAGGRIHVQAICVADQVDLTVRDTGAGMPPEQVRCLFDAAEDENAEPGRRRGVGLLIVKRIVDACGGSIDVTSSRGIGTRFTIRLPRVHGASAGPDPTAGADPERMQDTTRPG